MPVALIDRGHLRRAGRGPPAQPELASEEGRACYAGQWTRACAVLRFGYAAGPDNSVPFAEVLRQEARLCHLHFSLV